MKKKGILVIGIVIVVVLLLGVVVVKMGKEEKTNITLGFSSPKYIEMCDDKVMCFENNNLSFGFFKTDTGISEVDEQLEFINKKTQSYYNKVNKSDSTSSECRTDTKYKHSLSVDSFIKQYADDKYISVCIERNAWDLCKDEAVMISPDLFIYDVSQGKVITEDEFKKKENISQEQINSAIKNNLEFYDMGDDVKVEDAKDIHVFYGEDEAIVGGKLEKKARVFVTFYHPALERYSMQAIK